MVQTANISSSMQFTKNKKVLRFLWQFVHRREWNLSSLRFPYHIVIAAVRGKLCKKVFWSQTGKHSPKTIRDHLCKMEHLQKKLDSTYSQSIFHFQFSFWTFVWNRIKNCFKASRKEESLGHVLIFSFLFLLWKKLLSIKVSLSER